MTGSVSFSVADAIDFGPGPYDVVTFFDALHDLGDPVTVLRRAYELLSPGGIVVAVEPWSTDRLDVSIGNPIARLNRAISTSMCTPTSSAQPGCYGLGTCGGRVGVWRCSPAPDWSTPGLRSTPGRTSC